MEINIPIPYQIILNSFHPENDIDYRELIAGNELINMKFIYQNLASRNIPAFITFLKKNLGNLKYWDENILAKTEAIKFLKKQGQHIYPSGSGGYIVSNVYIDLNKENISNMTDLINAIDKKKKNKKKLYSE